MRATANAVALVDKLNRLEMRKMTELLLDTDGSNTQRGKYLTFLLGTEFYGIEIRHVTEIIGMQNLSSLPQVPDYVKGIINLRNKIIPIIDMRVRFKKEAEEYTDRTCIIVVDVFDDTVGLIVDRVDEVVNISDECISAPPSFTSGQENKYLKGIGRLGEDIRLILDCEKLFGDDELQSLHKTIEEGVL